MKLFGNGLPSVDIIRLVGVRRLSADAELGMVRKSKGEGASLHGSLL